MMHSRNGIFWPSHSVTEHTEQQTEKPNASIVKYIFINSTSINSTVHVVLVSDQRTRRTTESPRKAIRQTLFDAKLWHARALFFLRVAFCNSILYVFYVRRCMHLSWCIVHFDELKTWTKNVSQRIEICSCLQFVNRCVCWPLHFLLWLKFDFFSGIFLFFCMRDKEKWDEICQIKFVRTTKRRYIKF